MKKLCLLSGMIVFGTITPAPIPSDVSKNPGNLKEKQRQKIESVQWGKIERQKELRELARPPIYKMVDALIKEESPTGHADENGQWIEDTPEKIVVDWPAVFAIIDSMHGTIDVNEYDTPKFGDPLLWVAVEQGNFAVAEILLEKYKANPNIPGCKAKHKEGEVCTRQSLLRSAQQKKDFPMALLLRQHGANL